MTGKRSESDLLGPDTGDDNAERSVIGSMLRDPDLIDDVCAAVTADEFRLDSHGCIFRAILALRDAKKPVDAVALADELNRRQQIANIGGYVYLTELWDAAPTAANAVYYAGIVRERAKLRQLALTGDRILRTATERAADADVILEQAEQELFAVRQRGGPDMAPDLSTLVNEAFGRYDARLREGELPSRVKTGIDSLDKILTGLEPGSVTIVCARSSVGKSALGLNMALNAAAGTAMTAPVPTLFVSVEMKLGDIIDRMLCAIGSVDLRRFQLSRLNEDEAKTVADAGYRLRKMPLRVERLMRVSEIAARARRLKLKANLGLLVIDYIQLLTPDSHKAVREQEVAEASRKINALSKQLDIPIVVLSQLNRENEKRADPTPRISDNRESAAIEMDADNVLLLHHPNTLPRNYLRIIVGKQRNGPTGEVDVIFDRQRMQFSDPDDQGESAAVGAVVAESFP